MKSASFFVTACIAFLIQSSILCNGLENRAEIDPDNVVFQLFTRRNPNAPQILRVNDQALLDRSNFNTSLPVKIFSHGWVGFPNSGYSSVSGWLEMYDCNAISVDWSVLADGGYDEVAANGVPVAGATLGAFVDFLIGQGTPVTAFHLVGFSMGAHVVGNAGAAVTRGTVPRITGLDPASVGFPLTSPDTSLDISDAEFVDIIHTDIAYINQTGHTDFYPNGGLASQPGCSIPDETCCNHCRAVDLYAESITAKPMMDFRSVQCDSYNEFLTGMCNENTAALMGEPTPSNTRGTFYLYTSDTPPYALG